MDKQTLAEFMWKTRSDIHGNYPDSDLRLQCQMIQDWVDEEAEAILAFLEKNK